MKKTGIVIGATGLIGTALLKQLLANSDYGQVKVLHRRSTGIVHPKLKEHIIDFEETDTWSPLMTGDVLFSALGTTKSKAGSKEAQYKIDFTYQYEAAKAAAANGVSEYVLVSSAGADPNSSIFYPRIKGELEEAIKKLDFKSIHIFQPSILDGERNEFRLGEKIGLVLMKALSWVPGVRKYRPIKDAEVARAMQSVITSKTDGTQTYTLDEIFKA